MGAPRPPKLKFFERNDLYQKRYFFWSSGLLGWLLAPGILGLLVSGLGTVAGLPAGLLDIIDYMKLLLGPIWCQHLTR